MDTSCLPPGRTTAEDLRYPTLVIRGDMGHPHGIARFEVPQNAASLEFDWIIDLPFRVVQRPLHSIVQIELEASWKSAEWF
jgi:hypothetical protein